MNSKHTDLNIPLVKRSYSGVWFLFACVGVAFLIIKPSSLPDWIATITVMAPTVWFIFVGPKFLWHWESSRYIFVGWLIFAMKMALFLLVLKKVVPYVASEISAWFSA